jgi:hypothetical protein
MLPAGDVLTHWCVKPGEVYGAGSSCALDCCCEHVGLSPVRGLSGRRWKVAEGEWCQVEVLFDRVAGLDVGKATLTVCVRTPGPRSRRSETRTFREALDGHFTDAHARLVAQMLHRLDRVEKALSDLDELIAEACRS